MNGFILKNINLYLLVFLLSSCNSSLATNNKVVYKNGNDSFVLERDCIDEIGLRETKVINESIVNVFLKIKNSDDCAYKFNSFIEKSIGKRMVVYFNNVEILKSTPVLSSIRTENGFSQSVPDKKTGLTIIEKYDLGLQ